MSENMQHEKAPLPEVSVLMSVYREPVPYIEKAVCSILKQTFQNIELLIVLDDPGNGEARQFLSTLKSDSRVRILENKKNGGLAKSLNRLIRIARGDYLARMDADDIAFPDRIEKELKFLKENSLDMVGTGTYKIDENGSVWDKTGSDICCHKEIAAILPVQNVFVHPTIMIRRETALRQGGYRNFPVCQDYDLWLRLLTEGCSLGILNEPLLYFRRHSSSVSSQKAYTQVLVEKYIRRLYRQRLKTGHDRFSEQDLHRFLRRNRYYDQKYVQEENELLRNYQEAVKEVKSRRYGSGIRAMKYILRSHAVREKVRTALCRRWKEKHDAINIF